MAVKKSRTGKKKRPEYGPQGTKKNETQKTQVSLDQFSGNPKARKANYGAIACLVVAMVVLLIAPNVGGGTSMTSIVLTSIAYLMTVLGGGLIMYTSDYIEEKRKKMTRITGVVMIVIGAFGLSTIAMSLFR